MSMDVVDGRILPVIDVGMSPALMWGESCMSAKGAALACPLCRWANLHLGMVHFAAPVDMYTPVVDVDIDAGAALVVVPGGKANRGPVVAVGYWCEAGCRGRVEFREHKGHVYLSLREESGGLPEEVVVRALPVDGGAAVDGDPETTVPF